MRSFEFLFYQDYVFCKVKEDVAGIDVGDVTLKTFHAGEIHVVPYICIRAHVLSGKIFLI
jgi:hypothetical protein